MTSGDKEARRDLSVAKDEHARGDRDRAPYDPSSASRQKRPKRVNDINSSNVDRFLSETKLDIKGILEKVGADKKTSKSEADGT